MKEAEAAVNKFFSFFLRSGLGSEELTAAPKMLLSYIRRTINNFFSNRKSFC